MEPETQSQISLTELRTPETSQPQQFQQLTRKQLGQLRRMHLTKVNGTVTDCGHKANFSATKRPRNNCISCWKAFFMTTVDLEDVHKTLTEKGVKALVAQYGTVFVKNFHGFLSTQLVPAINTALPENV